MTDDSPAATNSLPRAVISSDEDLTPLRTPLSSKATLIVLDNAESFLNPQGTDIQDAYTLVEELSRSKDLYHISYLPRSPTVQAPRRPDTTDGRYASTTSAMPTIDWQTQSTASWKNSIFIHPPLPCLPQRLLTRAFQLHIERRRPRGRYNIAGAFLVQTGCLDTTRKEFDRQKKRWGFLNGSATQWDNQSV